MRAIISAALFFLCAVATPALAGYDDYGLGNGQDGDLNNPGMLINASARLGRSAALHTRELCLDNLFPTSQFPGFQPNRLVLIHQSAAELGLPLDDDTRSSEQDLESFVAPGEVGQYELGRILSIDTSPDPDCSFGVATLDRPLFRSYSAPGAQVVTVPEFVNVTGLFTTWRWNPWDGRGGILAFLAQGEITGITRMVVSGLGHLGVMAKTVDCGDRGWGMDLLGSRLGQERRDQGGGARCALVVGGAGGGGHIGPGGYGGYVSPTLAGRGGFGFRSALGPTYSPATHMLFGGGGGASQNPAGEPTDGAPGGGIIFFRAYGSVGTTTAEVLGGTASTTPGYFGGGGGGGAGGTIVARLVQGADNLRLWTHGGSGQGSVYHSGGGGGGGGGGLSFYQGVGTSFPRLNGGLGGASAVADGADGGAGVHISRSEPFSQPAAPTLSLPADGSTVGQDLTLLQGTAPAGSLVSIYLDGAFLGRTTAAPGGHWELAPTPPPALGLGAHQLLLFATQEGISSSVETSFSFEVPPPPSPVIETPADGSATSEEAPLFAGSASGGVSVVRVYDENGELCRGPVDLGGQWKCRPVEALPEGAHTVTARSFTDDARMSLDSLPVTFVLTRSAPNAPRITAPLPGSWVAESAPLIQGRAAQGQVVDVSIDGSLVCAGLPVNGSRAWQCVPSVTLVEGEHIVQARARDRAGNVSAGSVPVSFRVSLQPPPTPIVMTPQDASYVTTTTPLFSGYAMAGTVLSVQDVGGMIFCQAIADEAGQWACISLPLAEDHHYLRVFATNPAGRVSEPIVLSLGVDLTAPQPPEILRPVDGSFTNATRPDFTGTGETGSLILISVDDEFVCATFVDAAGVWTCTATADLSEGLHTVEAWAEDGRGNWSDGSSTVHFTVHLAAPDAPAINSPVAGSWLNEPLPVMEGTAVPGVRVDVYVDGSLVCPGVSAVGGNWECAVLTPLDEGSHAASAIATDLAGNVSAPSPLVFFQVVTTSPGAPAIAAPLDGSRLTTRTPIIRGAAEPASLVSVHDEHDTPICAGSAGPTGLWSCSPLHPLSEGVHGIYAVSADAAGNVSLSSPRVYFAVDLTAPLAPLIVAPVDGSVSNDRFPRVQGSAEGGSRVRVEIDGVETCAVRADGSGAWSCYPAAPLADGTYAIRASARDAAGNDSPASALVYYTVETASPAAPTILAPVDGVWTREPFPAFAGLALAGSRVDVDVDGLHACDGFADASGSWACTSTLALGEGAHQAVATATSAAGNTSLPSESVSFTVALVGPAAPVIAEPAAGAALPTQTPLFRGHAAGGLGVQVLVGGVPACSSEVLADGSWSCLSPPLAEGGHVAVALATDPAGNVSLASEGRAFTLTTTAPAAPFLLAPADGSHLAEVSPLIAGSAEPFAWIEALVDGAAACHVAAAASGAWACRPAAPLEEGSHLVQAFATDVAGNVSPSSPSHRFTVLYTAPAAPVVLQPVDGSHTRDPRPALAGSAQTGTRVEVLVDGVAACDLATDAGGDWRCLPAAPLHDGLHKVQAVAVDLAGNRSAASTATVFTVKTTLPAAPAITAPEEGDFLSTALPTVSGTGVPGGLVQVHDENESLLCFAEVVQDGSWTCAPDYALAAGEHRVHAKLTDIAGNVSDSSGEVAFTLLLEVPDPPVVLQPAQGLRTKERTPLVQGSASPLARVEVEIDEAFACAALADFNGDWSCRPDRALEEGMHEVRAAAADEAGNVSDFSAPLFFRVDLTAPTAPLITEPAHGSATRDDRPLLAGLAPAGHDVELYLDGNLACEVRASAQGKWQCLPAAALEDGLHVAVAFAVDPVGNASTPSAGVSFAVSTALPPSPTIVAPEDGGLTNEARPRFVGAAAPGLRVELRVGGELSCVAVANELGEWDCAATFPLRDGTYQAQALSRDEVGHPSEPSPPVTFTVDTTVPEAPIFDPPDGRRRPSTFRGTAEPGTTVWLEVDGAETCSSAVAEDGTWSCTAPVSGGNHRAIAFAVDLAGNESPEAERRFKVIQAEKVGGGGSGCSTGGGGGAGWAFSLAALLLLTRRRTRN